MKQLEKNEKLEDLIKTGVYIVDFYAIWCGPCKMIAPFLEEIDNNNVISVDVDEHTDLASSFGVMSVPTLIYFKDGEEVKRTSGFQSKEMIEENLKNI